ncbi:MAG: ParB N-terminal domain-containing protein [Syntrophobacteraceae bacterium]|nr:ParB N-terminal domain-containing protein [Syntrophobacteraceae bacterium]
MGENIREIEVTRISPNRRIVYSAESIEEMEQSIRDGQQAPILIRFEHDSFRIVDGEKRWRACKRLGRNTVRAIIVS